MSRKRDKPNDPQTDEKTLEFQVNKQEEEMKKSIIKNESDVNNRKYLFVYLELLKLKRMNKKK